MWITVLLFADVLTQIRIVYGYLDSLPPSWAPMVKLVNHATLVERQIQLRALLPAVAFDAVEALVVQLRRSAEQM